MRLSRPWNVALLNHDGLIVQFRKGDVLKIITNRVNVLITQYKFETTDYL